MQNAEFILATQGPLSKIWLAAHWDRKFNKNVIITTDIMESIENILSSKYNISLKNSGQLLLGIIKIYARQIIYLLQDCNEIILTFKSQNINKNISNNINIKSKNKKNIYNNLNRTNYKNNQSRIEDITIQPPINFLNSFQDTIFNIEPEMMRFNINSSQNISYEVARDQSIIPDLTLDQSDVLNNDLTLEKSQLLHDHDPSILSNVNIDDIDINDLPNEILDIDNNQNIDSVLNNYTIGSINISKKLSDENSNLERLSNILLDPILGKSKLLRKRKLIIDDIKVISNEDIEKEMKNFKNSLISINISDKENIPPQDNLLYEENPLMTIRNCSNISKPSVLALKCSNLLNSTKSYLNFNETTNDNFNTDINDITFNNTIINDTNYGENLEDIDYNNIEDFNQETIIDEKNQILTFNNNLNSFEKYDCNDTLWSESTILMAKNLQKVITDENNTTFKKYIINLSENITKKSITQNFYSLLILQRENSFNLKQDIPYGDIIISVINS